MRARLGSCLLLVALSGCSCEEVLIAQDPPLIVLSTDSIDFGQVPVDATARKGLTVLNSGEETLEVQAVTLSGADAAAFGGVEAPLSLKAGEEYTWRVSFTPDAERAFAATLSVESNADNAKAKEVALSGAGVAATTCGPCDQPPEPGCLSEYTRISWSEIGVCVDDECQYEAVVEDCPQGCDPATRRCTGVSYDAALPDAGARDAERLDRVDPDRAQPDRDEPDRARPDRAEPDRARPDREGLDTTPVDRGSRDLATEDAGPCVPATCDSLGRTCGRAPDGCGDVLDCGSACCSTAACPSQCTNGCAGGTCVIDCGNAAQPCVSTRSSPGHVLCPCDKPCEVLIADLAIAGLNVHCPETAACTVSCTESPTCGDLVIDGIGGAVQLTCAASSSCSDAVVLGGAPTAVSCERSSTCGDLEVHGGGQATAVTCSGSSSCSGAAVEAASGTVSLLCSGSSTCSSAAVECAAAVTECTASCPAGYGTVEPFSCAAPTVCSSDCGG